MKKKLLLMLAICLIATAGCLDEKREITLNPDGSGKMVYGTTFKPSTMKFGGTYQKTKTEGDHIAGVIKSSEGIDMWEDMSCKKLDDGKICFTGTAYFRNLNNVKMVVDGTSFGGAKIIWSKNKAGEFIVIFDKNPKDKKPDKPKQEYTEKELARAVAKAQASFAKKSIAMAAAFSAFKNDITVHMPGKIDEVTNFTKSGERAVKLLFTGDAMVMAMNTAMQNDDWLAEQLLAGRDMLRDGPEDMSYIYELMYGEKAPIRAVVKNPVNRFDYDKAVAAAAKKYMQMLDQHGIEVSADLLPKTTAGMDMISDIEVAGIQWAFSESDDWNMKPFNSSGYKMALTGKMPYIVSKALSGKVHGAVTGTGQDLTPESHSSKINFPKLSKDKKTVLFEINMKSPDPGAKAIKKASGVLEVMVASNYEDVDLGVMNLAKGTKVDKLGVEITENKANKWSKGRYVLSVKIKRNRSAVKSVKFYDESGQELKVKDGGTSSSNKECTLSYNIKGQWPEKAKIVVNTAAKIEKRFIGFELNDVSLFGNRSN